MASGPLLIRLERSLRPASFIAAAARPALRSTCYAVSSLPNSDPPNGSCSAQRRALLQTANTSQRMLSTAWAAAGGSAISTCGISSGGGDSSPPGDDPGTVGGTSGTAWPPPLDEWLRSHGGTINGVELRSVLLPSGVVDRQLRATTDHPPGALLISVSRKLQVRYDNIEEAAVKTGTTASAIDAEDPFALPPASASAVVSLFATLPVGSDSGTAAWQFKQALTLLYHMSRGLDSPLLPYIAHLPGLAPGVPTPRVAMLLTDDAVEELQYSNIVQDIQNQKYWLRHVCKELFCDGGLHFRQEEAAGAEPESVRPSLESVAAAFNMLAVDEELFGWAVAVAMSRCFGLSRFHTHTCVPLVDMANHVAPHSASNCEIRTGPDGEVNMVTKRQVRAGEELTLTYGTHDNHNLLLSYGFTLQSNPYDAFYFDMDLSTVEILVEELLEVDGANGSGGPRSSIAAWQRDLIESKLGLRGPEEGTARSVRVYLSAVAPSAISNSSTCDGAAPEGPSGGELHVFTPSCSEQGDGPIGRVAEGPICGRPTVQLVQQPVDPRLMTVLRIATLQDEAWHRFLDPQTADQIGAWGNLLARQQEITLMRVLAALVTGLYTTFPTTIQQDRELLAAAAATTVACNQSPRAGSVAGGAPSEFSSSTITSSSGGWVLRPFSWQGVAARGDSAAAITRHSQDMSEAVRFRLGLKITLERCLQMLVARARQLDALQQVR